MRGLHFSLNQGQKIRLQRALQELQDSSRSNPACVTVADTIPVNHEDGVLKGHGTSELNGEVVATLCGAVERVNKLVLVRSLRARYKPEVGEIIVGRVIEVVPKRWRLDINFSQDAVLMLSSMNMPDGIQRRRTAVDELNMRSIFEENDVVCAEVRGFQHDGSLHLQARSQKYGKLERGQLLKVSPYLVKRSKQHFHHLEDIGVDLILGCNGFIWVGEHVEIPEASAMEEDENKPEENRKLVEKFAGLGEEECDFTPLHIREHICRIANAIRILSELGFTLTIDVIMETARACVSSNMDVRDMLGAEFYVQTAEREVIRRSLKPRKKF